MKQNATKESCESEKGRKCRKCNRFKLWNEFHRKKGGINGNDSKCKKCRVSEKRKYRKKVKRKNKIICGQEYKVLSKVFGELTNERIDFISKLISDSYKSLKE